MLAVRILGFTLIWTLFAELVTLEAKRTSIDHILKGLKPGSPLIYWKIVPGGLKEYIIAREKIPGKKGGYGKRCESDAMCCSEQRIFIINKSDTNIIVRYSSFDVHVFGCDCQDTMENRLQFL
ncbi:hypothetical protein D915_005753 [Fasciola hepatica]|uniref:Uncharacterized protein n=1 Tax=Fasciola hepatica TaxID=6192 RepID=A0A4E0RB56_FASHE|nr:hypothetical protein D915_005753 [Fasciola hepatica]